MSPTRSRASANLAFDVKDLQDVADGDVGQQPALGGDDHRGSEHDVLAGVFADRRGLLAELPQPLEPCAVAP